ncbi:hypothetical protein HW555_003126 [Spodoptera exigua]|uniref:Gag-like protein n=1 Tax=Spodoptera exigua TaxID=7107 RepID=A0A835L6H9_SPOEX|nr:hypothetical protein HW555_003126 [Spodoptera exigua]
MYLHQSAVSARTRKRTKTQVRNDQSTDTTAEKVNPITVDSTIVEKLVSDNADLRSQIVNLSASVEKLLNQYNSSSCQVSATTTMVTDLPPVLSHGLQSSTPAADTETWATVVRKNNPQRKTQPKAQVASSAIQKKGRTIVLPKVPTTAVIAITIPEGSSATYAEVMFEARQHIQLSQFGIESLKQRIGMTGGMLLEISGADCNAKADKLATRMQEVLADIDVRITRPCKMGEIIILDVDESVSPVDVAIAVAEAGGCSPDDVKVGAIRRQLHSLGRVWVRCPLATVKKLSSSKKFVLGGHQ